MKEDPFKSITYHPTLRFDRFDFAPIDLETINENVTFDGTSNTPGTRVALYYDRLVEDGNLDHFFYVGSGI